MVERFFIVFFGAGFVAPLQAPTVGAAAAETDDADHFGFLREAGEVSRHRSAGGMAEGDDLPDGEMLVGERAGTLQNDIECAFQIAVGSFIRWEFTILEIKRISLRNGKLPNAALRIVAGVGER